MEEINERANIHESLLLDAGKLFKKQQQQWEFRKIMLNEISQIQENVLCDDVCVEF